MPISSHPTCQYRMIPKSREYKRACSQAVALLTDIQGLNLLPAAHTRFRSAIEMLWSPKVSTPRPMAKMDAANTPAIQAAKRGPSKS